MLLNLKRFAVVSVSTLLLSGLWACGPASQSTHYSAQIGRFCEDGVSFTVPLVVRSAEVSGEDQFWELRRGIGNTIVTALAPLIELPDGNRFRSNVVLTKNKIDSPTVGASEFAKAQIGKLRSELQGVDNIEEGADEAAPWVCFTQVKDGLKVYSKAWFFVEPVKDDQEERFGYVLLGSAIDYKPSAEQLKHNPELNEQTLESVFSKFYDIAATFSFGRFRSGFIKHAEALTAVADKLAYSVPSAAAESKITESAANGSEKSAAANLVAPTDTPAKDAKRSEAELKQPSASAAAQVEHPLPVE
ncbi:MAG: hypothetical protein ACI376_00880 [Candidatus Bruticola sp.]